MIPRTLDRAGIHGARAFALVLGTVGLLLDFTIWFIGLGLAFGIAGALFALVSPRDRIRTIALALNAFTVAAAGVLILVLLHA